MNSLLGGVQPVLIHNDFADWSLLTKDGKISGVLDFDECVGVPFSLLIG
jgi:Ser/Thr protein kinase RdoA (MazF antagonist)